MPSNATVSRFFERTVANPDLFAYGWATLTRELRSRVWDAAGDRNPALAATAVDPLILDLDATLVTAHSDKEQAVGTYKGGYGFAPFIASVDYGGGNGGGEILAALMRPADITGDRPRSQSPPPRQIIGEAAQEKLRGSRYHRRDDDNSSQGKYPTQRRRGLHRPIIHIPPVGCCPAGDGRGGY